ncbi:hypothetical protein MRB53_030198 [Persea americana]|uniref:Uncharacterized protein n=1 Tax=Persea americana TaxID=3435 RepID=A0ACC2KKK5_PERAE|nr:hypothetical protein MRB53_030198 [Persea americana]
MSCVHSAGASFPVVDGHTINYNEVARELTGKRINWIGGSLNQNRHTDSYRLLNIFIHHNVNPKGSKAIPKELVDFGKEDEQTEDVIIPKQKIDRYTFDQSKSHLTLIDLEDDDDDDDDVEGYRVGPLGAGPSDAGLSGAGPSQERHLNEGELRELNEHLRCLEVRVDDGFMEMCQGFSDLLDLLCRF